MKTTKEIKIKEVDQVILDVPDNINIIAVPAEFFKGKAYYSEYYDGQKFIPIMAVTFQMPVWEKVVLRIMPRGGYIINSEDVRYVKYARVTKDGIWGYIILERTGEYINGIPVFKVSTKEPEAIAYKVRIWKEYKNIDLQINEIINAIDYEVGFVSKVDGKDDSFYYIGLIMPMDKEVVIDYIYGRRYRFVLKWDKEKKDVTRREYRYEDLKEDEII